MEMLGVVEFASGNAVLFCCSESESTRFAWKFLILVFFRQGNVKSRCRNAVREFVWTSYKQNLTLKCPSFRKMFCKLSQDTLEHPLFFFFRGGVGCPRAHTRLGAEERVMEEEEKEQEKPADTLTS